MELSKLKLIMMITDNVAGSRKLTNMKLIIIFWHLAT